MSARRIQPSSPMRYLLDTNICIYLINRKPPEVFQHFEGLAVGDIGISSITGAELACGVAKSGSARNSQALEKFLAPLDVIAFDATAMHHYGPLRARLEKDGIPIGPLDMLIAAHALALGYTLVTSNLREFERVPGLALENWVA
ncbi:MAG: type II toxin-antitoxin system VapC family toxin [Burkholderiaceae bacterium]